MARPSGLSPTTCAPCVLVLKTCKQPDDVLFINAAERFDKGRRQNFLNPEYIDQIVDA